MPSPLPEVPARTVVREDMRPSACVSAAQNDCHAREVVSAAVRSVVDHLEPPLSSLIRRGDRVLVKANMGCSGFRNPEDRVTSHPAYLEAIIECLLDCGARVTFVFSTHSGSTSASRSSFQADPKSAMNG